MKYNIDLVYLWVDDTDTEWSNKKNEYLKEVTEVNKASVDKCRFSNNNELKYSLRSVTQNAPWINKIFIVTDNQVPDWLNLSHPKIKIVNHSEIIPKDKLPLFNSCAIESRIPFIEGLSEYFLYANDDTFFWEKVEKDFFFKDNKPIYRYHKFFKKNKNYNDIYRVSVLNMYKLLKQDYILDFKPFLPHHNIDPYRKTLYLECFNLYKENFENTLENRFRTENDVQRIIVSYYSILKKQAILKPIKRNFIQKILNIPADSICCNLRKKRISKMLKLNTRLLCINDCEQTTSEDRNIFISNLEQKFSDKSEFEK